MINTINYNFEWDFKKAKTNIQKHKISFENAALIFKDNNAISLFDKMHSQDEERWVTIGMDNITRVLVVIHTFVEIDENNINVRIISARKANLNEQKTYYGE